MNLAESDSPLIAIIGPTASGKSSLGVFLAERLGGEVVACDSTQLYRGFDIGTAKPSLEDRKGIPHHLIDVLDFQENATAGGYREKALAVLADLKSRRRIPIFTVGTGLYFRALFEGLAELPQRSEVHRDRLRVSAQEHPAGHLHRLLKRLDPESANKIAPADEQKLIRAIEIRLLTRKPVSELHRTGRMPLKGWRVIKIGLAPLREQLYSRIHARTGSMLERGWLNEIHSLIEHGTSVNAKAFDFIGYRELRAVALGEGTLESARTAIQQATRQYAKRQITWFRRENDVHWLGGFGDDSNLQSHALNWILENTSLSRPNQPGSV
jgi:tRNA dimethylallyltransferase